MPRGLRKRGRRHKKGSEEQTYAEEPKLREETPLSPIYDRTNVTDPKPPWIIPAASQNNDERTNQEAPFGCVDAEVKAYFRTVDSQIQDWQETEVEGVDGYADVDPNEGMLISSVSSLEIDGTYIFGKKRGCFSWPR